MPQQQRYVSRELTHFVGAYLRNEISQETDREEQQYKLLCTILNEGRLGRNRDFPKIEHIITYLSIDPSKPLSSNNVFSSLNVCFCDIPIEDLSIHMNKYSRFGLSFIKGFLVQKGANPVSYIAGNAFSLPGRKDLKDSYDDVFESYRTLHMRIAEVREAQRQVNFSELNKIRSDSKNLSLDEIIPLLAVMRFLGWHVFSQLKFFDTNTADDHLDNFYMEREWRVIGTVPFSINDVHRIILPSAFARRFREEFPNYYGQLTFAD
jgi:hypothetical protein